MKKLPANATRLKDFTLLAVCPNQEDRQSLQSILGSRGWKIQGAKSIREAILLLLEKPSLILCERDLPDGTWKDLFREAQRLETPVPVLVASRTADRRFWAEVLNLGAFDVLLKPFEAGEVTRVMNMAFRQGHMAAA